MSLLKKVCLLAGIAAVALFDIAVYASYHYYYRAASEPTPSKKVSLLGTALRAFPYNDRANYELGKAYFEWGGQNFSDPSEAKTDLEAAVQYLGRSLDINPSSPYVHLYLGQALLHLGSLASIDEPVLLAEFRKAAALAGEDSQVFNEVGRVFLSRWADLSPEDRDLTRRAVRKALERKDRERLENLLNIWELNVKDYSFMDEVLPPDAQEYRQYAEFLGRRSLSLEERIRFLSRAEGLDFSRARSEHQAVAASLVPSPSQEALNQLAKTLRLLRGIKFYQTLREVQFFSTAEYAELLGSVLVDLAKARFETGAKLEEVEEYLHEYLTLESRPVKVEELEAYLRKRGVLSPELEDHFEDLNRLALGLWLRYKQVKYRQVADFGRILGDTCLVVPESKKPAYVRVLQLVGDSYEKIDSFYSARDYFLRALQAEPENVETLLRIRTIWDRLNEPAEVAKTDTDLKRILTPAQKDFMDFRLRRGELSAYPLILDGRAVSLELSFGTEVTSAVPLVSVFFNDGIAWEGYLTKSPLILSLATRPGKNVLQVRPVNEDIGFVRMKYWPDLENSIETSSRRLE
jgi:hypothetical protein